jgi:adenylosuccinate synthase
MKVVLGSQYGDEAKGLTVSFLCEEYKNKGGNPLVVRSSGSGQAGHTVNYNGNRHVFSNFGSGTMQGVPTYWSEYCPLIPLGVLNEYNSLKKIKGLEPKLYVNPLSPVTTPYDKKFNCEVEKQNNHGSCGMGFGQTIQRQEDYYKLFVQDLFHERILIQKLVGIKNYYAKKFSIEPRFLDDALGIKLDDFLYVVNEIKKIITVDSGFELLKQHDLVFEGSQGILLDQDFGFFPNVTRSNTTSKNAIELMEKHSLFGDKEREIYYITRAYQTRHGNGFMTNEGLFGELNLKNNELETNVTNEWQGNFRKSVLDLDLLNYALQCDSNFSMGFKKNLVITCVDQVGEVIPATISNVLHNIPVEELSKHLNCVFSNVYISRGDSFKDITLLK